MNRRMYFAFTALAISSALVGCSTTDRSQAPALERGATWAVLPFENHTETPMAGNRAEAIAAAVLHSRVASGVHRFSGSATTSDSPFGATQPTVGDAGLVWAKEKGAAYALTGSVDEWRYKVGVDGEPAVGVALRIVDVNTGATVWSGAGGKSGWSREALSSVGQKLIRNLLDSGLSNAR